MSKQGTAPDAVRASGGRKDSGVRFDLIPVAPLWQVAEVYTVGAQKYAPRNWENGYAWSLSYAAMQRHLMRFWMGEDYDPEGGQHHLASVVFHALALMEFGVTHPELDDRQTDGAQIDTERIKAFVESDGPGTPEGVVGDVLIVDGRAAGWATMEQKATLPALDPRPFRRRM